MVLKQQVSWNTDLVVGGLNSHSRWSPTHLLALGKSAKRIKRDDMCEALDPEADMFRIHSDFVVSRYSHPLDIYGRNNNSYAHSPWMIR